MNAHVDDDAALYALGAMQRAELDAIDRHAATCPRCAAALAQAADDVTAIEATYAVASAPKELDARVEALFGAPSVVALNSRVTARPWYAALAVAAAFLLGLVPGAYFWNQDRAMRADMIAESAALSREMTTPHREATFASATDARVTYGADGSWYCIVIRGATEPVDVVWKHDGQTTILGTAVPHGDIAMLYLPKSHRMDRLALMQSSNELGDAQLVF